VAELALQRIPIFLRWPVLLVRAVHEGFRRIQIMCSQAGLNPYGIRWNYLPRQFFGGGTLAGKAWKPGMVLQVPQDIVLHHANWTIGIENKIAQLKYVKNVVDSRKAL